MIRWFGPLLLLLVASSSHAFSEDGFFDSNGVKIRYVEEGQGEPVLLIHGFTADLERQWVSPGLFAILAKSYRTIAYDNRGHGKSGKPHDPMQYGSEMVKDAVRLLDHLEVKRAHVIGYSMGASIVNKLLVAHPDRLLSATLGGNAGKLDGADFTFTTDWRRI
jgi:pimeloyl-ACP methyl ester carboxylesterase